MKNSRTLSDIQFYSIENAPYLDQEGLKLREKVFNLWHPQWSEIYLELGSEKTPTHSDFLQYGFFNCLVYESEVIGMTAHKFLNVNEPLNPHSDLFSSLGWAEHLGQLKDMEINKVMTFESLLIDKKHRRMSASIQLAKTLVYLGNHFFAASPADAIIATARRDIHASKMSQSMGYQNITNKIVKVFDCDLNIQVHRDLIYPEDPAWHQARRLWSSRNVYASQYQWGQDIKPTQIKKAA